MVEYDFSKPKKRDGDLREIVCPECKTTNTYLMLRGKASAILKRSNSQKETKIQKVWIEARIVCNRRCCNPECDFDIRKAVKIQEPGYSFLR